MYPGVVWFVRITIKGNTLKLFYVYWPLSAKFPRNYCLIEISTDSCALFDLHNQGNDILDGMFTILRTLILNDC
jgi:hypothetical protein